MTVAVAQALVSLCPTRWSPPLPSHKWTAAGVATVGDGSGGLQQIEIRLLTDVPLNVPSCSLEDISVWSDDSTHYYAIFIRYGGGLFDVVSVLTPTGGTGIGANYYTSPSNANYPGLGLIRSRQPGLALTSSSFVIVNAINVNTKLTYVAAWGYLWQIPEQYEPWRPEWGMPPLR
jgi:hypothetical protein